MFRKTEDFFIDGVENKKIHIKKVQANFASKIFIVFHGICEHSGRYNNLIDHFCKRNTTLYLADHRGHGLSEGIRGNVEDFNYYIFDAIKVVNFVKEKEKKKKPLFVLAHSMGGLVISNAVIKYPKEFMDINGIILSSPAYKIKDLPDSLEAPILKISGFLKKYYIKTIASAASFINDPREVKKYNKDQLIVRRLSPGILNEIMKAIIFCKNNIEHFTAPVLLLAAGKDSIIDPSSIINHYQRISSTDKKKNIYSESYHELFNDLYRKKIFADIHNWVLDRMPYRDKKLSLFQNLLKKIT